MSKRAETYQGEESMRGWLEGLPGRFAGEGRVIYKGRNELREMQAGAGLLVGNRPILRVRIHRCPTDCRPGDRRAEV